jgi:hypothetical protein
MLRKWVGEEEMQPEFPQFVSVFMAEVVGMVIPIG